MARRLFTLLSLKTGCSCFVSRAMAAPRTSCRMTLVTCCIHESHPTAGGWLAPASYTPFKSGTGPPANADLNLALKNSSHSAFKLVPRPRPFSSYVQASFRLKLLLGDCVLCTCANLETQVSMQNNMSAPHELGSRQGNARDGEMKAIFSCNFRWADRIR